MKLLVKNRYEAKCSKKNKPTNENDDSVSSEEKQIPYCLHLTRKTRGLLHSIQNWKKKADK